MSGSSLDGLDICFCRFTCTSDHWDFDIPYAETIPFSEQWKNTLRKLYKSSARELAETDASFGELIGQEVQSFIRKYQLQHIDLVASHGHTIFHDPQKRYTTQIGSGAHIAAITQLPAISDFRILDTALGGQGAPLVPIGDELLFPDYDYCLNLGGYSNISFKANDRRVAFDICPVNKAVNYFMQQIEKEFDKDGELGRKGTMITDLLNKLNNLDFYRQHPPKSLGDDWLNNVFFKVFDSYKKHAAADLVRTIYEHIAHQIAQAAPHTKKKKILTTGGGAHNNFLIERIQANTKNQVVIPENKIVDFKEASIFAFMGVLRYENQPNCLSSVTGAQKDNSGGTIFHG